MMNLLHYIHKTYIYLGGYDVRNCNHKIYARHFYIDTLDFIYKNSSPVRSHPTIHIGYDIMSPFV